MNIFIREMKDEDLSKCRELSCQLGFAEQIEGFEERYEKFRRMGVGKAFLNFTENWTKQNGLNEIFLLSSLRREDAHRFYEKNGYSSSKQSKFYVKDLRDPNAKR